jgi:hypothetical protein
MNNTWIKVYRKIIDHDVFRDESAFRVFMWILCSVDYKTGTMISGRFWGARILRIKDTTYYGILKRLEKKYDLLTLSSNNKNTVVSVKKWEKYQADNDNKTDNKTDNKLTTNRQQTDTNQELRIKNKEKTVLVKTNTANAHINFILENFETLLGYKPTDKKPRFEANTLLRQIKTTYKELDKPVTDESLTKHLTAYFRWLSGQDWFSQCQTISVVRRKYQIFKGLVVKGQNE